MYAIRSYYDIPATNAVPCHLGGVRTAAPLYRITKGGMNITAAREVRCQNSESKVFQRYSGKHHRKIRNDRLANALASASSFAHTRRYPAMARATTAATRLPCA